MAAADETRKKIQEQINKLLVDEQLAYRNMLRDLDIRNASEQEYVVLLKSVKREFDDISSSLSSISSILADNVNELTRGREAINKTASATRKLSNIASHLLSIRKGEASYDQKRLNSLKDEAKRRIDILNIEKAYFSLGTDERKLIEENISQLVMLSY
jgi:hypothetical protein